MGEEPLTATLRHRGVSPWEIEVLYSYLHSRFRVDSSEIESDDTGFASVLYIGIPVSFSEEFFEWFDFRRWENVKSLLKEMKRRRGRRNALMVDISFAGAPAFRFVLDADDRQWYNNALEKIDFVLELLPYHLADARRSTTEIVYRFDEARTKRWRVRERRTPDGLESVYYAGELPGDA